MNSRNSESNHVNMPFYSIIIPVFNTYAFLRRCVRSIQNQSYKDFEIILVDDGSTDGSGSLCDEISYEDSRIVVVHKENGGLSSARNAGIIIAKGQYICFVDSDDYIEPSMLMDVFEVLNRDGSDIVCCGRYDVYSNIEKIIGLIPTEDGIISPIECFSRMLTWEGMDFSACDKVFKSKLFDNYKFPIGKLSEDVAVIYKIVLSANKISLIPKPLYNYCHRQDSITTSSFSERSLDVLNHANDILEFVSQKYPNIMSAAIYYRSTVQICIVDSILSSKLSNIIKYWGVIKSSICELDNRKEILKMYGSKGNSELKVKKIQTMQFKFLYSVYIYCKSIFKHSYYKISTNIIKIYKKLFLYNDILLMKLKIEYCRLKHKQLFYLLSTPYYGNVGDQAIILSERKMLLECMEKSKIIEVNSFEYSFLDDYLKQKIRQNDVIVLDGGGNFGDTWPHTMERINNIVKRYSNNRIIIFPESWFFQVNDPNNKLLQSTIDSFSANKNVLLFARDTWSMGEMKKWINGVNIKYAMDMVFYYGEFEPRKVKSGVIGWCIREDKESALGSSVDMLKSGAITNGYIIKIINNDTYMPIRKSQRKSYVKSIIDQYKDCELIITDRFHGMVFAILLEIPCLVFDNKTGKVRHSFIDFAENLNGCRLLSADDIPKFDFEKAINLNYVNMDKLHEKIRINKEMILRNIREWKDK